VKKSISAVIAVVAFVSSTTRAGAAPCTLDMFNMCQGTDCPPDQTCRESTCRCVTPGCTRIAENSCLTLLCAGQRTCANDCDCVPNGTGTGDPHIYTWDGLAFDFQAVGEFVLARTPAWMVQVRQEPWKRSTSVITAAAMQMGANRVAFYLKEEPPLRVNGEPRALGCPGHTLTACQNELRFEDGGRISRSGKKYTMIWPEISATVEVTIFPQALKVRVTPSDRELSGLLGNGDDDSSNDLQTRDRRVIPLPVTFQQLYAEFRESWRILPEESLFDYRENESTETFTDRDYPPFPSSTETLDSVEREAAREICTRAGLSAEEQPILFDGCVLDVAVSEDFGMAEAFAEIPEPVEVVSFVENYDLQGGTLLERASSSGCSCRQERRGAGTMTLFALAVVVVLARSKSAGRRRAA
jgi:hypothetical protein